MRLFRHPPPILWYMTPSKWPYLRANMGDRATIHGSGAGACRDSNIQIFLELAMWGGVSTMTKRHGSSNIPLIPETFDPVDPMTYIMDPLTWCQQPGKFMNFKYIPL